MRTSNATPLDDSTRLLKAFADPVRLRLLNRLGGGREVCVCHMYEALELPQPTVSRHLAYLRRNGLVVGRKQGLWVHYRMAKPANALHRTLVDILGASLGDPDVFDRDRRQLAGLTTRYDRS
jgi:ArsR family transcriptional regulator, arsenate/arsenite/antimonite-responsive transcriptional repressor